MFRKRKKQVESEPETVDEHPGVFFQRPHVSWVKCCDMWFPAQRLADGVIESPQWDWHKRLADG